MTDGEMTRNRSMSSITGEPLFTTAEILKEYRK